MVLKIKRNRKNRKKKKKKGNNPKKKNKKQKKGNGTAPWKKKKKKTIAQKKGKKKKKKKRKKKRKGQLTARWKRRKKIKATWRMCIWAFLLIKKKFIPIQFSLYFGKKTFWWARGENIWTPLFIFIPPHPTKHTQKSFLSYFLSKIFHPP